MNELPDSVHEEIKGLCATGDDHAGRQAYADALASYWAAWDLLPEPKTEWEAATWILVAIGDANFLGADYVAGRDNLSIAMRCPGAFGNPFIHFRLGQCQLELGNDERAADELMRAYMGPGGRSSTSTIPSISVSSPAEQRTYDDERAQPGWCSGRADCASVSFGRSWSARH